MESQQNPSEAGTELLAEAPPAITEPLAEAPPAITEPLAEAPAAITEPLAEAPAAITEPLAEAPAGMTEVLNEEQKFIEIDDLDPYDPYINWIEVLKERFGYIFDENSSLKDANSGESFKFLNQSHYEKLGDVILHYIQYVLKQKYGLVEVFLPLHETNDPKCLNIFHSQDFFTNEKKALLLIQGTGAVRAGQWARSVCINDTLTNGTVFPFLDRGFKEGYSCIIFNPNLNRDPRTKQAVQGNSSFSEHACYMWKHFIRKCPAEELYIVAHSCGGASTTTVLKDYWEDFRERVKAIAFTDSVHSNWGLSKEQKEFLLGRSVDWVGSQLPLDTLVMGGEFNSCVNVSSGHHKHEYTTGAAFPSIFPFFRAMAEGRNPYIEGDG